MFFLTNPIEITAYTSFLFVWAVHLFGVCRRNTLIQKQKNDCSTERELSGGKACQGISILVLTQNQEKQLPGFLKQILNQDYDNFEVVVVDQGSTDNTRLVIEEIKKRNEQMQCTFVPQGTRQLSPHTLALTLGVKAARYSWVVVLTPNYVPTSKNWLARMSAQMTPDTDFVLGCRSTHPHSSSLRSYYYLTEQSRFLTWSLKHRAYRCNEVNLAFRKEHLLSCRTLGEYGKLLSGVESILLNRSSRKGRTAVCLHPEALLLESREPSEEPWTNELLYQKETERYYAHKQGYQWSKCIQAIFSWLLFLLSLTCISLSIAYRHWEYTASTVVLLLIWMFLRARLQKEKARLFQIKSAGLYLPFYDLRLWCLNQATSIRYAFKDRKIFYRKMHP